MLSEETEQKIVEELVAGYSLRKVAKIHGVSLSTVQRVKEKYEEDSNDDSSDDDTDDATASQESSMSEDEEKNMEVDSKDDDSDDADSKADSDDTASNADSNDMDTTSDDENFGLEDIDIDSEELEKRANEYQSQIKTIADYSGDVRKVVLQECSPSMIEVIRDICVFVVLKLERTEREDRKMEKHRTELEDLFQKVSEREDTSAIRTEMSEDGHYLGTILNMFLTSINNEADKEEDSDN